tara:strand:+ start:60 stop:740 length:681 start_codon:yes stop_codon:yes gene_type:complete
MKKQVNELWIWPPGASGNFVMVNHYGSGTEKPNNEFQVEGPVKWIPMFFNKIHAYHYLKIGHTIRQDIYEDNIRKLVESKEENLSWHWVPIYLKEYLDINEIHYILPKPNIQWYISFLTLLKNRTTNTYNKFVNNALDDNDLELLELDYKQRVNEVNSFATNKTYIIDYESLFFKYDEEVMKRYNLTKDVVEQYTHDNITLVRNFVKENLSTEQQQHFLPKLDSLV